MIGHTAAISLRHQGGVGSSMWGDNVMLLCSRFQIIKKVGNLTNCYKFTTYFKKVMEHISVSKRLMLALNGFL